MSKNCQRDCLYSLDKRIIIRFHLVDICVSSIHKIRVHEYISIQTCESQIKISITYRPSVYDSQLQNHHGHFMYNFQISMGDFTGEELIQAAIFNDAELMKCLLEGECVNFINFQDRRGRTAVYTSVSNNSSRCLRILLEHGGNIYVSSQHFLI